MCLCNYMPQHQVHVPVMLVVGVILVQNMTDVILVQYVINVTLVQCVIDVVLVQYIIDFTLVQYMIDVILVQYIIGDHIEALLPEQEDLKCKVWSFVSSFTGQTWMTGQAMMMLYKGHNRPRRSERPEVQPPGLAQESSAQRPDSNKHARLGHKPRAQHGQDVGQASKSANMPNAHSLQAEAHTSVTPMQQQAVASPAHLSRAQNAEAQRSKEYSMEDILADLSQGTAQHKLNLLSRQADAGMGLSDLDPCQKLAALSMPGSWRRLQAEHEQQARYREMAKRLQDDYDIEAAAHEGFVVNRSADVIRHAYCPSIHTLINICSSAHPSSPGCYSKACARKCCMNVPP